MKKILFAAVATLAITSCSQNEEFDAQKSYEIGFTKAAVTRATVMGTNDLRAFKVFGYAHTGDYGIGSTGTSIMDGNYNSTDGSAWTEKDSKTFYWPVTDNVSFFAYSPIEVAEGAYKYTTGYPTISYTIEDAIADQADFLVCKLENQKKAGEGKVSLGFNHALTQVLFKLKGAEETATYTVTKVTIKGLKNMGTYNYADATWTSTSGIKDYSFITNKNFEGGDDNAVTLNENDQLMILMPQELNGVVVEVVYSVKTTTGNISLFTGTRTATLSGTWGSGQKYTYTLALKAGDSMDVSGSVNDNWDPKTPDVPVENNVAP